MKVAYFSPLPPDRSGIADYSALLLPELEKLIDVETVRPGRTRPVADADVAVYHIGNNPEAHGWIVDALRRRPGIVVLHEFVLHHLVAGLTIGRKDGHAYLAAMEREAGIAGRMLGHGVLEGRLPPLWEVSPEQFPLAGEILDRALGLIVHSRYVDVKAREHGYEGPIWHIPMPAWPPPAVAPAKVEGSPVFGCFGHMNESKRIPELLQAFSQMRAKHPDASLLLVGGEAPGFDLAGRLERSGVPTKGVVREPYVEEDRLWSLIAGCDACVQLRAPTMGETSAAALRTLSLGVPLVVSDIGWFAELPDDVALKVPAGGPEEVPALAAALDRLASEPELRERMRSSVVEYVAREHDLGRAAREYVAALETVAGAGTVDGMVLDEVARAAADSDVELELIAPALVDFAVTGGDSMPRRSPRAFSLVPVWLWLGSLYAVSVVVTLSLALRVRTPWVLEDELVYSDAARSFAKSAHFFVRGVPTSFGFLYPLAISPAYALFGPVTHAYDWARVTNALLMCSALFPAYLLSRRVVRPPAAVAAAALAIAIPSLAYTGTLLSENISYPLFLWLVFVLVGVLERPTFARQALVIALCAVSFMARAQAIAFFGAALSAPLAFAWIERGRRRNLAAFTPLYAITALAILGVLVDELARGRSPVAVLGHFTVAANRGYGVWPIVAGIVQHIAEIDLAVWIVPFAAAIALIANARHLDRPLRAFCAVTTSMGLWLIPVASAYASRYSHRIEERYLIYLFPLLIVSLFAWIERGQPRPPRAAVVAAGLAAALPGAIPLTHLLNVSAQSDTIGLLPWWVVADTSTGRSNVAVAVTVLAFVLAASFLWLPARYAPLLPVVVAAGFVVTWLPVELSTHGFPQFSHRVYSQGIGPDRTSWIDRAVGRNAHVAAIWAGGNPYAVWNNEFWNRSLDRVYDLGARLHGDMPEVRTSVDPATGQLVGVRERYVVADSSVQLVGRVLVRDPAKELTLYRVSPPARITTRVAGLYPTVPGVEAWSRGHVSWIRTNCSGGTLQVLVSSDTQLFSGTTQKISVSGTTPSRTVRILPAAEDHPLTFPLTAVNRTCRVDLAISPTRIPARYPRLHSKDTRSLGLHFTPFSYTPT